MALGGNALLQRGEQPTVAPQRRHVREAVAALAGIAGEHDLVIVHGNGPQVGLLAIQSEASGPGAFPLDVLDAESEGMIGYLISQELGNVLGGTPVATLLTQVVVDASDPAFDAPTKPIGAVYERAEAERLREEHGWAIAPDGAHWRRVVPSPEPRSIVELSSIRLLVEAGVAVVCAGGGGIPVVEVDGRLRGVEAVVDKDLAAAVLAVELQAETLLMLTDVSAVELDWRTPQARPIGSTTPRELRQAEFAAGSMAPKIEAACRFVEATGARAAIGALGDAEAVLAGERGTQVRPSAD